MEQGFAEFKNFIGLLNSIELQIRTWSSRIGPIHLGCLARVLSTGCIRGPSELPICISNLSANAMWSLRGSIVLHVSAHAWSEGVCVWYISTRVGTIVAHACEAVFAAERVRWKIRDRRTWGSTGRETLQFTRDSSPVSWVVVRIFFLRGYMIGWGEGVLFLIFPWSSVAHCLLGLCGPMSKIIRSHQRIVARIKRVGARGRV